MSISKLLTTLLGTAPTAKNTANPLNNSSLHYKKTKIPISTILFLLTLYTVCINLMIQLSHIQGHEILVVLYAHLDGGDCRFH